MSRPRNTFLRAGRQPEDQRKKDLAAIHANKKQLGLDDDTYRELLENTTGLRSAADLNAEQRGAVLRAMAKKGAGGKGRFPGKPSNFDAKPMLERIEQLLTVMALPWSYADGIARHMFQVERVSWLAKEAHLRAVIAALDVEQTKRSLRTEIATMRAALHLDDEQIAALFSMPPGWDRKVRLLKSVWQALHARCEALRVGPYSLSPEYSDED